MRLVFWLDCLSIHQLPYIVKLLDDDRVDEVVVIGAEDVSSSRIAMGWKSPKFSGQEKCKIYVHPDKDVVKGLLTTRVGDSFHFFAGIRGFSYIYEVFKQSLNIKELRRAVISEGPITFAFGHANCKPKWLHWLRWSIQDCRNIRNVQYFFAMGNDATKFYSSLPSHWKVFPFAYCTYAQSIEMPAAEGNLKVSFVGSLCRRKSVDTLVRAIYYAKHMGISIELEIIGDGEERKQLESFVRDNGLQKVKFLGTQSQDKIPSMLASRDVLVLPSIHDGWGAVANEALQQGLYVICSDHCGAKSMLVDERLGCVFHIWDYKQLADKLSSAANDIDNLRANKQWRKDWAARYISGEYISKYMIDCLCGVSRSLW